jgi:hypothetical protein
VKIIGLLDFSAHKVLLELGHTYLFMCYSWLLSCYNGVEELPQKPLATKPKIYIS